MPECGPLDLEIVDENGDVVVTGEPNSNSVIATAEGLAPGAYFVVVRPSGVDDFNFYDRTISVTADPGDGSTGGDETGASETDGDSETNTSGDSASDSSASASASASNSASASDSNSGEFTSSDSGDDGDTDDPVEGDAAEADGCGCRHMQPDSWPFALLLPMLAVARRRR
jgi:MYXO-CTERM domain-containing protein